MFADEGDELLIGDTEYIVLNKYTEDGKEYLFVANIMNPDENIAENFDSDAVKLLLLSQDELMRNSAGNDYIIKNFLNSYVSDESFGDIDEDYTIVGDTSQYFTTYHQEEEEEDKVKESKTTQFFNVEKQFNFIEKILEVMFLM